MSDQLPIPNNEEENLTTAAEAVSDGGYIDEKPASVLDSAQAYLDELIRDYGINPRDIDPDAAKDSKPRTILGLRDGQSFEEPTIEISGFLDAAEAEQHTKELQEIVGWEVQIVPGSIRRMVLSADVSQRKASLGRISTYTDIALADLKNLNSNKGRRLYGSYPYNLIYRSDSEHFLTSLASSLGVYSTLKEGESNLVPEFLDMANLAEEWALNSERQDAYDKIYLLGRTVLYAGLNAGLRVENINHGHNLHAHIDNRLETLALQKTGRGQFVGQLGGASIRLVNLKNMPTSSAAILEKPDKDNPQAERQRILSKIKNYAHYPYILFEASATAWSNQQPYGGVRIIYVLGWKFDDEKKSYTLTNEPVILDRSDLNEAMGVTKGLTVARQYRNVMYPLVGGLVNPR